MVGTVTWPTEGHVVKGLAGFFAVPGLDPEEVRTRLRKTLPAYMVPERLENLADMPLSGNGKVDRKALVAGLDANDQKRDVA